MDMRHKSTSRPCTWTIALIASAGVVLGIAPASATNFSGSSGRTGCANGSPVNKADNKDHSFFYENLTEPVDAAQTYTRTKVYDPTVIATRRSSRLTDTTDVVVGDRDYDDYCGYPWHPSGVVGLTTCNSLNAADECEKHSIRYDISYFDSASTSDRRGAACHETGHSLGLTHRGGGCMSGVGPVPTTLSSHDETHLGSV